VTRGGPQLRLAELALAALAEVAGTPDDDAVERRWLVERTTALRGRWRDLLDDFIAHPAAEDAELASLAARLELVPVELLALGLLLGAEEEPLVGRVLTGLQAPLAGSLPTVALVTAAFGADESASTVAEIVSGAALASGLYRLSGDARPLVEQTLWLPTSLYLAARRRPAAWPGISVGIAPSRRAALPVSFQREVQQRAAALGQSFRWLVIRSGHEHEARSIAAAIARARGHEAAFIEGEATPGLVPWLLLQKLMPVFVCDLGPSDRRRLPALPYYDGPSLVIAGIDGIVESPDGAAMSWSPPVPPAAERHALWELGLGDAEAAALLAREHRHGVGRIAELSRLSWQACRVDGAERPTLAHVRSAAWAAEGTGLGGLAQPLRAQVSDEALVAAPSLREELEALLLRCRMRDGLESGLGASMLARYRPGVRALFVGASGTGKTLAAGWLATRLGLPLYRVDLASVTSKYIGETEKNLSQLLGRAEQAEIVLLFDEADAMFGKRTDINESNDRFANAQTNYLLQRIESFEGIVVLTSNSRARFDTAFARRLDAIIDFPPPAPEERRALWYSHLGTAHTIEPGSLNMLAALVDLPGGNIRNVVLAAAVQARAQGRPIRFEDLVSALGGEYRKVGRSVPHELRPTNGI
jgi:ATPase family associated with various cellular activities (AAA)